MSDGRSLDGAGDVSGSLQAVEARVGYLRAATHAPAEEGWLTSSALLADGTSLSPLVISTGVGRGTHDAQVAASLFAQAYAFRIAGTALAAYALGSCVPSTAPRHTAIRIDRHRPAAVAYLDTTPYEPDPTRLAGELLGDHLTQFIAAIRSIVHVGERLLWGNTASSCARAFRAIEGASPGESAVIRRRANEFFETAEPWLGGLGRFVIVEGSARQGWFWERTNCCLWYQASGGSMCDDCSLLDPDERLAGWRRQLDEVPA